MKKTKVFQVLSKFSIYELNSFEKFIISPYFNSNERLILLFRVLRTHLNEDDKTLEKKAIWQEIDDKTGYDDTKFRKLCSDLLKLVEQYFAQIAFESKQIDINNYLLQELVNRKERKLFTTIKKRSDLLLDRNPDRSSDYFLDRYTLEKIKFSLTTDFDKKLKKKKETNEINIETINYNLDRFYMIEKMKYFLSANTIQKIRNEVYNVTLIKEVTEHLSTLDLSNDPALSLYYKSFLAFTSEDADKYYFELKNQIFDSLKILPEDEARDIFEAALNFCIRKVNQSQSTFHKEALDLYKYALQSKIIFQNEELSPTSYRNIVIFAIREEEYDWAEEFIDTYAYSLSEKHRQNAINFNKARVQWAKKNFENVIELLRDVEYEDLIYNLNSKALILTSFYELSEYDSLYYFINSYSAFIRRNKKIKDSTKSNFLNFIKYISKLSKTERNEKEAILKISEGITNEKQVSSKKWLLEKVDELLK